MRWSIDVRLRGRHDGWVGAPTALYVPGGALERSANPNVILTPNPLLVAILSMPYAYLPRWGAAAGL